MATTDFTPFLQQVVRKYYEKVGTEQTPDGNNETFASYIFEETKSAKDFNAILKLSLPKDMPLEDANNQSDLIAKKIWAFAREGKFDIVDDLFARYNIKAKDKKFKRYNSEKGRFKVLYGDAVESATKGIVQSNKGKLVSQINLKTLLERLTRYYVTQDMTRGNANLKYRTGRFAHSVQITGTSVHKSGNKLSIFYNYMIRPYQVFDPRFGNKMSSNDRNPQRIIGQAVAKAARDIMHTKYKLDIQQGKG